MKILVVAPHADDEVLGCGGMIVRRVREGHAVDVVVVTVGTVYRSNKELKSTEEVRLEELNQAARSMGVHTTSVLYPGFENSLGRLETVKLISRLEVLLNEGGYDQVFIPYASHHQDHRIVHDACFSALRQGALSYSPSVIAMYEYPYISWTPGSVCGGRYYVDISSALEGKEEALGAYRSQLYPPPSPVSLEAIRTLASMRGIECGCLFAELFFVLKMVD